MHILLLKARIAEEPALVHQEHPPPTPQFSREVLASAGPGGRLQASLPCASEGQAGDWRPRAGLGYLPMQLCLKVKMGLQAVSLAKLKLLDV